ncbi:MAG: cytochrome b5 domain-containing protein [Chloroflexota bacterium]
MKMFLKEDLERCDGQGGSPALFAHSGRVYDVSDRWHWKGGRHHELHKAGEDLTDDLSGAPHGEDLLNRVPVVGMLAGMRPTKTDWMLGAREDVKGQSA